MNQIEEFAKSLHVGIFASRDTVKEAYDYACSIAYATDSEAHVLTAIHVLMNTISNHLIGITNESREST